jgi:hypothetical protein
MRSMVDLDISQYRLILIEVRNARVTRRKSPKFREVSWKDKGVSMSGKRFISLCLVIFFFFGVTSISQTATAQCDKCFGQGFRAAGGNAFWTVHDKYQEDCKAACTTDCKRRWRRLVAEHKRNNIPQVINNTPACSK